MKKENKKFNANTLIMFVIYLGIFFGGIVIGMLLQQTIIKQGIIDVLTYSEVEVNVDFNETKLVDELLNNFIPEFNESLTNSIKENNK